MPGSDATEVVPYLTSAALIMYAMRYLKTFDFYGRFVEAFPAADRWVHRMVAGVGALVAAIGIHVSFQGDFNTGWTFHGTIPDINTIIHGGWDWTKVYVLQQFAYDTTRRPAAMPHDQKVT